MLKLSTIHNFLSYLCTHSPLFVGIDRFEQIRVVRKVSTGDTTPKSTRVCSVTLDAIAESLWNSSDKKGEKYTGTGLKSRMRSILTPWINEMFFSEFVVLVEGEDDRAALHGAAVYHQKDLESDGISVIPCGGKNNLGRPIAILQHLGIPFFVVWDADKETKGARDQDNVRLLRLLKATVTKWPSGVWNSHACFETNLDMTIESEIGSKEYENLIRKFLEVFGFRKKKHAIKNPQFVSDLLSEAGKNGKTSATLDSIVLAIYSRFEESSKDSV